eukprot:s3078_g2.t1
MLTAKPHLNQTAHSGSIWVHQRSERVSVLLSHFRRLARQGTNSKCASNLTALEMAKLNKTLKKVELRDGEEALPAPLENGGESPQPNKKKLKKEISDVSMDSKGYPLLLKTPEAVKPEKVDKGKAGPSRLLQKRLIVEVSRAKSSKYNMIIDKIKAALEKDHLSKEEAKALKEELCNKCKECTFGKGCTGKCTCGKGCTCGKNAKEKAEEKQPLEKGPQEKKKGAIRIEVKKEQPEEKAPAKKDEEKKAPLKKCPKEKTPLKKGDAAASSSSVAIAKSQPHVMVDYHNVLSLDNYISPQRSAAMEKLLDAGVKVTVCSWCYKNRAAKVMGHMRQQPWFGRLEACFTTEARTGPTGKTGICKERGCQAIMDDSGDILEAALEEGIEIYPICTSRTRHGWWLRRGGRVFDSFETAVDEYLLYQEEEQ